MDYNTTREELRIPEYGRNVQKMVNHCLTLDDRDERNKCAKSIIQLMGQLNSKFKDSEDFEATLWSHLFIISNFELDVDFPFPLKNKEELNTPPGNVPYPESDVRYKHYGKSIEAMIQVIKAYEEGEEKDYFVKRVAELMKRAYMQWNRDNVKDDIIFKHIEELSGGQIKIPEGLRLDVKLDKPVSNNNKKKKTNKKRKR